ncbi:protein Red-like [Ornithodoros turicata]
MPEREGADSYSNPIAPPGMNVSSNEIHHPMTNEDFRKLIMTPRAPPQATPTPAKEESFSKPTPLDDDKGDQRRKKKKYYASLKRQEEDKLAELAEKYRDRARERRDGVNPDYQNEDPISSTAGYRAVAPDAKSGMDAAERRRQMIQESKFLGGDMEHTHLVKGLDYALLQKVRSEIQNKEKEDEELEETLTGTKEEPEEEMEFRTMLGRNIYRQLFRPQMIERNDLFLPHRMAYVIDLEDEFADSDIPTTLVRSKKDCPNLESHTTLTTNDIVINKLTQILSYLRQGIHNRKGKKKDKDKGKAPEKGNQKVADESIYGDIGEYAPEVPSKDRKDRDRHRERERDRDRNREKERDRDRDRDRESRKRPSYFEKPSLEDEREHEQERSSRSRRHDSRWSNNDASSLAASIAKEEQSGRLRAKLTSKLERDLPESYAECYPGAPENEDAVADSDDEVDYSKMDLGNKKGPIGRWDFDTQEEYSDYMSHKEALPKAAFQYGVKMADGRKTRRTGVGKRDDKAKLDRELQKINQIIARRKAEAADGGGVGTPDYKRPRY